MKNTNFIIWVITVSFIGFLSYSFSQNIEDIRFITYTINLKKQNLHFFLKNDKGENYGNHKSLKENIEQKNGKLCFAVNGGMYLRDGSPQGLYIEKGKVVKTINRDTASYGNFYLKPNGVFYITKDKKGVICTTEQFRLNKNIEYATQSGPMLVIDNKIHHVFIKNSKHLHIRNGVGILPNGELLFAMSKDVITFYDFAEFFKNSGCKNALYLDGYVSRTFLPSKNWKHLDGNFGVIIAETKNFN